MTTHVHPEWCGQGHVCSVDGPAAQHRSHPVTVDTDTVRLVVTRNRTRAGGDRVEVRVVADLPRDARKARHTTALIVGWVHQAVTRAQTRGGAA